MLSSLSVKAKSAEIGFDLCGVSAADRHPRLARLAEWIAEGCAGDMAYLRESLDERLDPARVLPTARTVISVACVYNTNQPYSITVSDRDRASIARYAWGEDYHDVLRDRLRQLLEWMAAEAGSGFEAFSCVDNGPVQERVFAAQAGLGWIGKNTCLIHPKLGSWLFLAEILTNVALETDAPIADQCGTCTRCIEACPTTALTPYSLDATRCLSYLTIETREPVNPALRSSIGLHAFGCDICQDVCPWNHRAAVSEDPAWQPRPPLAFPSLMHLCALSDAEWHALLKRSAMRRAGLRRIRRSLAYAAVYLESSDARMALDALEAHASASHEDVAEAIGWAREHARGEGAAVSDHRHREARDGG